MEDAVKWLMSLSENEDQSYGTVYRELSGSVCVHT
jgi:hypothetical protein